MAKAAVSASQGATSALSRKKRIRKIFGDIHEVIDMPNLIEVQRESYEQFLRSDPSIGYVSGLEKTLRSVFPIRDFAGTSELDFVHYELEDPKYDVEECRQRGITYAAQMKVTLRLIVFEVDPETEARSVLDIKEQDVYMGDMPLMTENGTFFINGTERVIVSQMHRSPGVLFDHDRGKTHSSGKFLFAARVIPYRGSWLNFEFDAKDIVNVRIDRKRKLPAAMRARGANVTDMVILVVAATEGVMPQTIEALNHAKQAKVPILVAVNKSDLPAANPLRARQQLQEHGLVPEEWGGETIYVDVSATTKKGVDTLLAMLVLQAEIMELKANAKRRAKGNVIESGLEPGGPTATVLVRKGTLKLGDVIICGQYYGRTRALINEEGQRLKEAGPSVAVKVLGLNGVPEAGLEFSAVENERAARDLAEEREEAARNASRDRGPRVTLENLMKVIEQQSAKVLKVLVKADTQGSVEAIVEALKKVESTKVTLEVVHSAVGTISKDDVMLAASAKGIIVGFHTRMDNGVPAIAKREEVQIKQYEIIYELIDDVRNAMAGLLDPELREITLGAAEIRQIFDLSKGGRVAGCMVLNGRIIKGKARVVRKKEVIHDGVLQTLRRFQDEVAEVRAGLECGIRVSSFEDFLVGDIVESYTVEKVPQQL